MKLPAFAVVLCLRGAAAAWAPVNTNDFKCLDDAWVASLPAAIQDEFYAIPARELGALGESARYRVDDARLTSTWQEYLTNATVSTYNFFGYGVPPDTPGRAVEGESSNTGWVNKGQLDGAIVVEVSGPSSGARIAPRAFSSRPGRRARAISNLNLPRAALSVSPPCRRRARSSTGGTRTTS